MGRLKQVIFDQLHFPGGYNEYKNRIDDWSPKESLVINKGEIKLQYEFTGKNE
jgi:hypothetical protein